MSRTLNENQILSRRLFEEVTGSWKTQALYVAAELKIPDMLSQGPKTVKELADDTGTHEPSLYRLLRALITINICKEEKDGAFSVTPMGELLQSDHPRSMRSWTLWWATQLWQDWGNLIYSVKTGQSSRKLHTGKEGFSHFEQTPETAAIFNQALGELNRLVADSIVAAYDFSKFEKVMDVGGGYGELLAAILKNFPSVEGALFDLPHVINGVQKHFKKNPIGSRCEFIGGDFFKEIPEGADACMLKSVIHDWNDEKSRLILKNCRKALGESGCLLLIERVVPEQMESTFESRNFAQVDLSMLVAHAAQERTEDQFRKLLSSTGFRLQQFIPAGAFCIIEAFPQKAHEETIKE